MLALPIWHCLTGHLRGSTTVSLCCGLKIPIRHAAPQSQNRRFSPRCDGSAWIGTRAPTLVDPMGPTDRAKGRRCILSTLKNCSHRAMRFTAFARSNALMRCEQGNKQQSKLPVTTATVLGSQPMRLPSAWRWGNPVWCVCAFLKLENVPLRIGCVAR